VQPGNPVVGGVVLRRAAIRSPDYVAGVSGWTINIDGTAEFNNVTVRGSLDTGTAPGGTGIAITSTGNIQVWSGGLILGEWLNTGKLIVRGTSGATIALDPTLAATPEIVFVDSSGTNVSIFYQDVPSLGVVKLHMTNITFLQLDTGGLIIQQAGDTGNRIRLDSSGQVNWGTGAGATDTDLYRAAAGNLETTSTLTLNPGGTARQLTAAHGNLNQAAGVGSTTSATYVNLPATSTATLAKQYTATAIKAELHVSSFITGTAGTISRFAVQVAGTDYDTCQLDENVLSSHVQKSGVVVVPGGVAAGNVTAQVRWRRVSGAGTLQIDGNDWISLYLSEVTA
jgi:hypothetical protein